MISNSLSFSIHNQSLAPSFSVPELDVYQSQKNIQVVSVNQDPLFFETDAKVSAHAKTEEEAHNAFFNLRLALAFGQVNSSPSYFPGAVIPGPGGSACSEFNRGNLLYDQFVHVLSFDDEMLSRLLDEKTVAPTSLFCRETTSAEDWQWQHVIEPKLYFIHQCTRPDNQQKITRQADSQTRALAALSSKACELLTEATEQYFSDQSLIALLTLISQAWFSPVSGIAPITWDSAALAVCRQVMSKHIEQIDKTNILPVLFEVEAMTSHVSLDEKRESFARGVFARQLYRRCPGTNNQHQGHRVLRTRKTLRRSDKSIQSRLRSSNHQRIWSRRRRQSPPHCSLCLEYSQVLPGSGLVPRKRRLPKTRSRLCRRCAKWLAQRRHKHKPRFAASSVESPGLLFAPPGLESETE